MQKSATMRRLVAVARKMMSEIAGDCPGDATETTAGSLAAQLAAVEDSGTTPVETTAPATVPANSAAMEVYTRIGEVDAAHPGVDVHTGLDQPTQPSADLVRAFSRAPLDALGARWGQVQIAYATGNYGRVTPHQVTRCQVLKGLWPLLLVTIGLLGAAVLVDVVYGQRAAQLLSGADERTALYAAIAFTVVFNGAAFFAAHWAYESRRTIVRRHGVKVLLGVLVLNVAVGVGLGLVVGGYDPIQISGVSGGDAAIVEEPGPDKRPLLTFTYTGIFVLVTVAIAVGHLLFLHLFDTRMVTETKKAEAKAAQDSLDWEQRRDVAISVSNSYLDRIPDAHQQGRRRVAATNVAFRHSCPPEISEMFDDITYDDADPDWAPTVREFIEAVKNEEPPAPALSVVA